MTGVDSVSPEGESRSPAPSALHPPLVPGPPVFLSQFSHSPLVSPNGAKHNRQRGGSLREAQSDSLIVADGVMDRKRKGFNKLVRVAKGFSVRLILTFSLCRRSAVVFSVPRLTAVGPVKLKSTDVRLTAADFVKLVYVDGHCSLTTGGPPVLLKTGRPVSRLKTGRPVGTLKIGWLVGRTRGSVDR
jgi:hypothetical protein